MLMVTMLPVGGMAQYLASTNASLMGAAHTKQAGGRAGKQAKVSWHKWSVTDQHFASHIYLN
jgi:hypothetical protein